MKAWQLNDFAAKTLVQSDVRQPTPGPGEVLVKVHAFGVTPSELGWYPTTHTKIGASRKLPVPAHEFSGVVASLGPGTNGVAVGDDIYGMNDWFADGGAAEYCVTRPEWIATKPAVLTHEQAASVPISALTAWQGLFDKAKLQAGERVLIHGGSGAVGVFAIQLGHQLGAQIITTASNRNRDFLLSLGGKVSSKDQKESLWLRCPQCDEILYRKALEDNGNMCPKCDRPIEGDASSIRVIDYHQGDFEKRVSDVDVVFDTVGGETLEKSWSVLSRNGRVVTVASNNSNATDERTKNAFFIVGVRRDELTTIAKMFTAKTLIPVVDAVVGFEQTAEAYSGKVADRKGHGKVVVTVGE